MNRGLPPWLIKFVITYVRTYGLEAHDVLFGHDQQYGLHGPLFDSILSNSSVDPTDRARIFAATRFNGNWKEVKQMLEM